MLVALVNSAIGPETGIYGDVLPYSLLLITRDNQTTVFPLVKTLVWIVSLLVFGGLALYGWRLLQRRTQSRPRHDEVMRRHVNRNYE